MIYQITIKTLKTMQTLSNIYQFIGAVLFIAFAYNFVKALYSLILNK